MKARTEKCAMPFWSGQRTKFEERHAMRNMPIESIATANAVTLVEPLLTVKQAAVTIGVCEETLRRAYLCRQLRVVRVGRRNVRIAATELQAWLKRGGLTTAVAR